MSQETLDLLHQQRSDMIELSPFSELFSVVSPAETFSGIFERAIYQGKEDDGNVRNNFMRPLIIVSEVPSFLSEGESVVKRENGEEYTFSFSDHDDEGVPILWLI